MLSRPGSTVYDVVRICHRAADPLTNVAIVAMRANSVLRGVSPDGAATRQRPYVHLPLSRESNSRAMTLADRRRTLRNAR
jgi:hypothetical protein